MANTEKSYKNTRTGDVYTTSDKAAQERLDGLPDVWQVIDGAGAAKEPKTPRAPRAPRTPKGATPPAADVVPADVPPAADADGKGTDDPSAVPPADVVPPTADADGNGTDDQGAE